MTIHANLPFATGRIRPHPCCGDRDRSLRTASHRDPGLYQGENLLVVNETNPDGVGFVERGAGQWPRDRRPGQLHAFEIDLRSHGIALGKGVAVRLLHRPGCAPRILNPEVIAPSPGFELISFDADDSGEVKWVTSEERGRMPFVLQQLKWDKWVDVVRIDGLGGPGQRHYQTVIQPIRGENIRG